MTARLRDISSPLVTGVDGVRLAMPKVASRPNGASAARLASKVLPPTISSTTSTFLPPLAATSAALRSASPASTVTSAPRSAASCRFSGEEATPMTVPAPHALASCTASVPTPPAAACTTTLSPVARCVEVRSRCQAVSPCTISARACPSLTASGSGNDIAGWTRAFSA